MVEAIVFMIIGIIVGIIITKITTKPKVIEKDYTELIKRCIDEANKDISNCGKKKHSNKS